MLRSRDYQAVNRILPDLYSHANLDEFASYVMQKVPEIVGSDVTGYTEINPAMGRSVGAMDSPESEAIFLEHKLAFEKTSG